MKPDRTLKIEVRPEVDVDQMSATILDACAEACERTAEELRGLAENVRSRGRVAE